MQLSVVAVAVLGFSAQVFAQSQVRCGRNRYPRGEVEAAADQACQNVRSDSTTGTYPHNFQNHEDFDFPIRGPYYNYPIMRSGSNYTGGSPGPDRVVINEDCDIAGQITHTGARGNGFVECRNAMYAFASSLPFLSSILPALPRVISGGCHFLGVKLVVDGDQFCSETDSSLNSQDDEEDFAIASVSVPGLVLGGFAGAAMLGALV